MGDHHHHHPSLITINNSPTVPPNSTSPPSSPRSSNLSPSQHPPSSSSSSSSIIIPLIRIPFRRLCFCALLPPLVAIIGVFLIAYWSADSDDLFNYEWNCGMVRLPSVSRVLNQPTERILWNFAISLHFPLRPLISIHYFFRWRNSHRDGGDPKSETKKLGNPSAELLRPLLLLSSLGDQFCLVGLSYVGERENADLHVCLFSAFLFTSFFHFTAHTLLFAQSQSQQHHQPPQTPPPAAAGGQRLRTCSLCAICLLVPLLTTSFTVHQLFCATYSYELFVLGEYLTIVAIFAFNCAVFLDDHPKCGYFIFICKNQKMRMKNEWMDELLK